MNFLTSVLKSSIIDSIHLSVAVHSGTCDLLGRGSAPLAASPPSGLIRAAGRPRSISCGNAGSLRRLFIFAPGLQVVLFCNCNAPPPPSPPPPPPTPSRCSSSSQSLVQREDGRRMKGGGGTAAAAVMWRFEAPNVFKDVRRSERRRWRWAAPVGGARRRALLPWQPRAGAQPCHHCRLSPLPSVQQ